MDVQGLSASATGATPEAPRATAHVVAREEWDRVEKLPSFDAPALREVEK
jgi:hypothetical protein